MISSVKDSLPGISRQSSNDSSAHLKFEYVNETIGDILLAPIFGECLKQRISDWDYKFCIGKNVSHEHKDDKKENYVIGTKTALNNTDSTKELPPQEFFEFLKNSTIT